MLGKCREAVFSSSPSVWRQCRVTLIPLISARAQQGRGADGGLGWVGGGGFSTPVSTSTDLGHTSLSACFLFLRLSLYQFFSPSFLSFSDSLACLCLLSFPTPSLALCLIQYWFTTTTSSTSTTTTPSHKPDPSIQSTQDLTNGSWLPVIWQAVAYERCNKAGNSSLAVS